MRLIDGYGGRAERLSRGCAHDVARSSMHRHEHVGGLARIRPVRHGIRGGRPAETDRKGIQRRIDHRIERYAKGRRRSGGLHAELDQIRRVVAVAGGGGIRIRARPVAEEVCHILVGLRRIHHGPVGAMIVVQKILVHVFAAAIRTRAALENRRGLPDARVDELRRRGWGLVQYRWSRARPGSRTRRSAADRRGGRAARGRRRCSRRYPPDGSGRRRRRGGRKTGRPAAGNAASDRTARTATAERHRSEDHENLKCAMRADGHRRSPGPKPCKRSLIHDGRDQWPAYCLWLGKELAVHSYSGSAFS